MASSGHAKQIKALLLIFLVVGHEGVRVANNLPDGTGQSPLEAQWIKEHSEHCVWSFRGCVGRAGEACKYRPFALDRGPGCRLRKTYVVHDQQLAEKFLKLEMTLLTESADFFESRCNGKLGAFQAWACLRKLGHIIRGLNFLVRVQESEGNITSTYSAEIRSHIEKATAAISSVLKDDKPQYEDLTNRVRANAVELAKDPESSAGWIRDTVKQLASSNETERMEARSKIAELPPTAPQTLAEEDLKELREVASRVSASIDPEVESEAFRKLEEMVPASTDAEQVSFGDRGEESTALLQKSKGLGIFPSKEALVILVEMILAMLLIVTIVYSINNQATVPLNAFTGALAGQIGTAAIVYFASGVDFSAEKSSPQPLQQAGAQPTQAAPPAQQTQLAPTQQVLAAPTQQVLAAPAQQALAAPTPRGFGKGRGRKGSGSRRGGSRRGQRSFAGVAPKTSSMNRAEIIQAWQGS